MNPANRFCVADYECLLADVVHVIDEAPRATALAVDAAMTTTYWLIARRIVQQERGSDPHALPATLVALRQAHGGQKCASGRFRAIGSPEAPK
jgi:hypothetical protein